MEGSRHDIPFPDCPVRVIKWTAEGEVTVKLRPGCPIQPSSLVVDMDGAGDPMVQFSVYGFRPKRFVIVEVDGEDVEPGKTVTGEVKGIVM